MYFHATDEEKRKLVGAISNRANNGYHAQIHEAQATYPVNADNAYKQLREICSHTSREVLKETGLYHCFLLDKDLFEDEKVSQNYAAMNLGIMLSNEVFGRAEYYHLIRGVRKSVGHID